MNGLGISWDGILLPERMRLCLVDTESGKPLGLIATGDFVSGFLDDRGFVIQEKTRAAYYDFSPRKDYRWLTAWSLGPIAGIWLLRQARRRLQLRNPPQK